MNFNVFSIFVLLACCIIGCDSSGTKPAQRTLPKTVVTQTMYRASGGGNDTVMSVKLMGSAATTGKLQISVGEKILFTLLAEDKYDEKLEPDTYEGGLPWKKFEPPSSTKYTWTIRVTKGDAVFTDSSGSLVSEITVQNINLINKFAEVRGFDNGELTFEATLVDGGTVPQGATGSVADATVVETWTFVPRSGEQASGLRLVAGGSSSQWIAAPSSYTYLATRHLPPNMPWGDPRVLMRPPWYSGQTFLETFTAPEPEFGLNDLKPNLGPLPANPLEVIANQLSPHGANSTFSFVFDHTTDTHGTQASPLLVNYLTKLFKPGSLANGIVVKLPQTYVLAGNVIGTCDIRRKFTVKNGVLTIEVKKDGPTDHNGTNYRYR